MQTDSLGLYLSIPFCRSKCTFCNFASDVYPAADLVRYVARLADDLGRARQKAQARSMLLPEQVDTVYLGGGTPGILSADQLGSLFSAMRDHFTFVPQVEITMEAAPALLEDETLAAMAEAGVNRISFGVQSFVDAESRATGRLHTAEQALEDLARARRAGIPAVSVDLIAGLPGQTEASWRESLTILGHAAPEHASVYMLEVDQDSRLGGEMLLGGTRYGAALTPSEDAVADFYTEACGRLAAQELDQYEISNFARPGFASRHNLRYWQRRPYLGLGLDAHSMLRDEQRRAVRFGNTDQLRDYLEPEPAAGRLADLHWLSREEELEEAFFLGLRQTAGVSLTELRREFGGPALDACEPIFAELAEDGLLGRPTPSRIRLTECGRLLSNEVFARLLGVSAAAEIPDEVAIPR